METCITRVFEMDFFLRTLILRHRKENLKKCSLSGLETREDLCFFTYPIDPLPPLSGYVLLTLDAPMLSKEDQHLGLFLIDGTWNYAKVMERQIPPMKKRRLPNGFQTAYPRKQTGCLKKEEGLASVEALYVAYSLIGRNPDGLLNHYYWKNAFLEKNPSLETLF